MLSRQSTKSRVRFSQHVRVGKDIVELLSSAMYVDPLCIFREYIQNAADSLDEAAERALYRNGVQPTIQITLDPAPANRIVKIRDTGAGISRTTFQQTLTAIGASHKRGTPARGFRGVGRLAGLGQCQTLVMLSKSDDDSVVSLMQWDCRRLKELLLETSDLSLDQMLQQVVEIDELPPDGHPKHFFEIEMRNVRRHKNDDLLNESVVGEYLSQVAPVRFHPSFSFGAEIEAYLAQYQSAKTYQLTVNGKPIYRPFQNTYEARPKVHGEFKKVEYFEVPGVASGTDAVGWILHSDYLGAIPDRHGIKGLRLRSGNIQIGDARLLDSVFPEPRFNAWTVGECHVLTSKLVPNARRDDFEHNGHYDNLVRKLTPKGKEIAKSCRDSSAERARRRQQTAAARNANGNNFDWPKAKNFFQKNSSKKVTQPHKRQIQTLLRGVATYAQIVRSLIGEPEPTKHTPP